MSLNLDHLQFKLDTDPAYFNTRMDEMLDTIGTQLPEGVDAEPVIQKCRWVLTELITNAYKHSGRAEILLRVQFHPGQMHIIKEDKGTPLYFNLPNGNNICWPLSSLYYNKEFNIIHDKLNILNASIDNDGRVLFSVKQDASGDTADTEYMNEHFGLIIIASVCREFTYNYEHETGKNIFKTVIQYRPG